MRPFPGYDDPGSMRVWLTCAAVSAILASSAAAQCPLQWLTGEGIPGVGAQVYAATAWDPDGPGPRSEVLVVGGRFTIAGDVPAENIALWDPMTSTWSALGSGTDGHVFALTALDGKLYAGGICTTAGGVSVNRIACWDPATSTWSALGSGADSYVYCLTVLDGKLYAGGGFSTTGGQSANRIAFWDPATLSWSALGSGIDTSVYSSVDALTVLDSTLYVGGRFTAAGGQAAENWARWGTGPQADFDCDLDVDGDDLDIFETCATGSGVSYDPMQLPSGCTLTLDGQNQIAADFDGDNDVDQSDFAIFQRCISGAGNPASPACNP